VSEEEVPQPKGNRLREEESRAQRYRRRVSALLILLAGSLILFWGAHSLFLPRSERHHPVKVVIPSGRKVIDVAGLLHSKGLIRYAPAFALYALWHGEGQHQVPPGRYTFSPDMNLAQIVRELKQGPGHSPDDRIHVSIPEGFTQRQIAARLEKDGVCDGTTFLQLARNPDLLKDWNYDFPRPKGSLEGYLYPDTYEFLPNTPPEKVLDTMLLNFSRRFARPYQQQIGASGRSLHEIVTIASLIEREAKTEADRPRIAGVLDNRLKKGLKLEIDATVLYALGHHKQRVLYSDLRVDSPYNTYKFAGLPPGPIASPGSRSLQAALEPEKNDYLYYVARPNGSHIFTRTLAEHEIAKRQARKERQEESGMEESPGG
jgi:UPF0755 protein